MVSVSFREDAYSNSVCGDGLYVLSAKFKSGTWRKRLLIRKAFEIEGFEGDSRVC